MNYLGENGTLCAAFDFETDEKEIFDKIESEHGIKKLKLKKRHGGFIGISRNYRAKKRLLSFQN